MTIPIPNERLQVLADRILAYSVAVNALDRVQGKSLATGEAIAGDEVSMKNQLEVLKEQYLVFREEFQKMRADYEHQFMTWHTELVDVADKRFTGHAAPSPWKGKVPEWADDESRLAAQADAEAAKALEAAIGG